MTKRTAWLIWLLCAVAPAAVAETFSGRTSCGAFRFEASKDGTFRGTVCERRLVVSGTHSSGQLTAQQVRIEGRAKPVELRRLRLPSFDPRSPAAVERWAIPFETLRATEERMRGAAPEGGFSEALGEAAALTTGIGGDVGCSDVENVTGAVIDLETSIRTSNFYVPPWCIVIVQGPVEVDSLRVDGVLIRSLGAIRARTVRTGTLSGGVFAGRVVAFGLERGETVNGAVNAVDSTLGGGDLVPGPGLLEADELLLEGGGISVDAAKLKVARVSAATATVREALEVQQLSVTQGGAVTAGALSCARAEANGGSVQVAGAWTGQDGQGTALLAAGAHGAGELRLDRLEVGSGSLTVRGPLATPHLEVRGGSVLAQDATLPWLSLIGGAKLEVSGTLAGGPTLSGEGTIADSALTAGTLSFARLDASGSHLTARGLLETRLLTGTRTHVSAGEALRAREGEARVALEEGSLSVTGSPVTGAPGFEACASHAPQIDVGTLEVRGGPVDATHVRADTLFLRGGHLWPKNPETNALCLEVARRTDVDGLRTEPFVKAPRLYAALADATVGASAELLISASGGAPQKAPLRFPDSLRDERAGASFGGFGGTSADLNSNLLFPAEEPGAKTASARDAFEFQEGGVGGWGERAGTGGGTIRIRASSLVFDGQARVNGSRGVRGNSGGSGGTIHLEVTGALSGSGLLQSNGGEGGFGDPGSLSAGGGSGGRMRIDCGGNRGWSGKTETLGGLGAALSEGNDPIQRVPAWDDALNHGGPGTVYWNLAQGPDRLVIENVADAHGLRGVGFLTGEYPDAEVVIRNAIVATQGFTARSLSLVDGATLVPNDPRVRLPFPARTSHLRSKPAGTRGLATTQLQFPTAVWSDPLEEVVTLRLSGNLSIDRTSALDVSRFGGGYRKATVFSSANANRAGGSHGGQGGVGRAGEPRQLGLAEPVTMEDVLEPTRAGGGGYGGAAFTTSGSPQMLVSLGGVGGGVLRAFVEGKIELEGAIRADGDAGASPAQSYHEHGTGGGAAGSIWLTTGALSGKGLISATGGAGSPHATAGEFGGGGGGGRVRIDANAISGWKGRVSVLGGKGASLDEQELRVVVASAKSPGRAKAPWSDRRNDGGPGTILWALKGATPKLVVDGAGGPGGVSRLEGRYPDHEVVIRGATVVSGSLLARRLKLTEGGRLLTADSRSWSHPRGNVPQWLPVDLTEPFAPHPLELEVLEDLEVDARSAIDASGAGGPPRADESCSRGAYMNRAGGSNAGLGGRGRDRQASSYGCPTPASAPEAALPGEGGFGDVEAGTKTWSACETGGSGGGVLTVQAKRARIDGAVRADGVSGGSAQECKQTRGTGGGAGGSIRLVVGTLEGRGEVSASGGGGQSFAQGPFPGFGGGGGGGRIALEAARCAFSGKLRVAGGAGASGKGVKGPELAGEPGVVSGPCRPGR